MVRFWTWNRIN